MGCDIHWVLEKNTPRGWLGICQSYGECVTGSAASKLGARNYEFFALLCGVRGEGPDPKGFPEDASVSAQVLSEAWGQDGHSHSWETLDVFCRLYAIAHSGASPVMRAHILNEETDYKLQHFQDLLEEAEYRMLFFFDN